MRQWEWKRQIMSLYHKRNHFDLGDPLKGSWRWPRPRGPRFENQRNRLIFKVTSQFIVLLRWMFCSPSRTTLWDLRSQDRAPSLVEPKAKSPGRSGGAFCLATGSRTRSPESAEDAGSRNQSQTCPPRAKAGPELAAGGRASPELRAEVAAATATATARDGSPETPATYPPAAGEPAPGRRSAAGTPKELLPPFPTAPRPPGIKAGPAPRVPVPARAALRGPQALPRACGPVRPCGEQGEGFGGAETEGLAAAGTTQARGSGLGAAGTCARSCRCGARRLGPDGEWATRRAPPRRTGLDSNGKQRAAAAIGVRSAVCRVRRVGWGGEG